MTNRSRWVGALVIAVGLGLWLYLGNKAAPDASPSAPSSVTAAEASAPVPAEAKFLGSQACKGCHAAEFERWSASQHAHAMQEATLANVLAPLPGSVLAPKTRVAGVAASFFRDASGMHVSSEGPSGRSETHEVLYTFGTAPIQQTSRAFRADDYKRCRSRGTRGRKASGGSDGFSSILTCATTTTSCTGPGPIRTGT